MIDDPNFPRDHWQQKLSECSKSGLIHMIETLAYVYEVDRETLLQFATSAKKFGRLIDSTRRYRQFVDDPEASELRRLQRKTTAIKAKRKHKKERA